MSENVQTLLSTFDRLTPDEQQVFVKEVSVRLKARMSTDGEGVTASDEDYSFEAAVQIFRMYDEEEARNGQAST